MASGILGQVELPANTDTVVYTVPAGFITTMNINILNPTLDTSDITVYLSSSSTPTSAEKIEAGVDVDSTAVLERTGIVMEENRNLVVRSSVAGIIVNAYGFEEEV